MVHETGAEDADINYPVELNSGRWGAYDLSRIFRDTDWRPQSIDTSFASYIHWLKQNE